ncbi:MAG: hypothetical protein HYX89_01680 [Chloroflexi bacterium]|nr:hypothetical protein [Chloroflexota bacterium]
MNNGTTFQPGSAYGSADFTASEFAEIIAALKAVFQVVRPDGEFRMTLHDRLVEQAGLRGVSRQAPERSIVRGAVVGAAAVSALSVAGLALMLLRHRIPAFMLSRSGLHAASGG